MDSFATSEEETEQAQPVQRKSAKARAAATHPAKAAKIQKCNDAAAVLLTDFATSEEECHGDRPAAKQPAAQKKMHKKPAAKEMHKKPAAKECRQERQVQRKPEFTRAEPARMSIPTPKTMPSTSGAFDFARWAVSQLTPTEAAALVQESELTIGSVCSGQSTETLAMEAIMRCVPGCRGALTFLCELDARKRKHLQKLHPAAIILQDVAELSADHVTDARGKIQDKPRVKILFAGISCKGLSGMNKNPESVLGSGSTGTTLRGLLDYVRSLPHEDRPRIIILENVANMAKQRRVEHDQVAAQIVSDLFAKLGYIANWDTFNSMDYFHPQCRDRLWMVFWRRPTLECTLAAHAKFAQVLHRVMAIAIRLQTGRHESLAVLMDRMGSSVSRATVARESNDITEKAKKENDAFMQKHNVVINAQTNAKFTALVRGLVSKRAANVCLLKLAQVQKQHGWKWEEDLLVATVSQSVNWISVACDSFPTLLPSGPFLVFRHGKPFQASGRLALAVQGVQLAELSFLKLADLPEALQQDFAGNAFSSNVCIALLLATLVGCSEVLG